MIYPSHLIVKAAQNVPDSPLDPGAQLQHPKTPTCSFFPVPCFCSSHCLTRDLIGNSILLWALCGFERHITSDALHLLRELHFDCSPHLDSIWIFGVDAMDSAADFRPLVHFDYTG